MKRLGAAFVVVLFALFGWGASAPAQDDSVELISPILGLQPLKRIALIPVVVHSSEDPAYLREGLRDMLVSRLEQRGMLEVRLVSDPNQATTNLTEALEIGRELDADFVLFGSFTRFGQGASLDLQCAATKGVEGRPPLRQIFVHAGDIASMIPDLDELVGKVALFVGEFGAEVAAGPASAGGGPAAATPLAPSAAELMQRIEALEAQVRELSAKP